MISSGEFTMAYKCIHRFARIAPRKARLVADLIRGMPIDVAMNELLFSKSGPRGISRRY